MTELEKVLELRDNLDDYLIAIVQEDGPDTHLRVLAALCMLTIDIAHETGVSHDQVAEMFIRFVNQHYDAYSGPTENDQVH